MILVENLKVAEARKRNILCSAIVHMNNIKHILVCFECCPKDFLLFYHFISFLPENKTSEHYIIKTSLSPMKRMSTLYKFQI